MFLGKLIRTLRDTVRSCSAILLVTIPTCINNGKDVMLHFALVFQRLLTFIFYCHVPIFTEQPPLIAFTVDHPKV